jgi:ubiquinone/menaquinone biosynthesis C-methylase UbiE
LKSTAKKKFVEEFVGRTPNKFEELEDRHRKVLEILLKYELERILDVGCGDGNFTMLMAKTCKAREVYGVEIAKGGVETARKNGIKCYQLDIDEEDLPFEDDFFDAVTALELIEHLFDPDHFLDEVYRVLKPNGLFILSTPNLASIHNRIALLCGYQPFPMGVSARLNIGRAYEPSSEEAQSLDLVRVFTLRSLKELLKIHGFKILVVKGSCAQLPRNMKLKGLFKAIDKFFAKFPSLSYRVVVACQKVIS